MEILKCRNFYHQQLKSANSPDASKSSFRHRISLTFCLVLFEYLTRDLEAALKAFDTQISHLRHEDPGSAEEEEALALRSKLIYRHSLSKAAYRPRQVSSALETALDVFPNNSIFLSLFLHNERRTRISGNIKRVLEAKILKEDTVTTQGWLFAIYAELHANSNAYNVHAVRALFHRAISNERWARQEIEMESVLISLQNPMLGQSLAPVHRV